MNNLETLRARRDDILRIAMRHGAQNVRVFGSVARGDATADSDVDLLVSTSDNTSPWFPAGLVVDLETLLGCRVQVVTEEGLYRLLRERMVPSRKVFKDSDSKANITPRGCLALPSRPRHPSHCDLFRGCCQTRRTRPRLAGFAGLACLKEFGGGGSRNTGR